MPRTCLSGESIRLAQPEITCTLQGSRCHLGPKRLDGFARRRPGSALYEVVLRRPLIQEENMGTKVRDVMSSRPRCVSPDTPVSEAAELMESEDVGALPVLDGDELAGMITDRDIVIRAVAKGKDPRGIPCERCPLARLSRCAATRTSRRPSNSWRVTRFGGYPSWTTGIASSACLRRRTSPRGLERRQWAKWWKRFRSRLKVPDSKFPARTMRISPARMRPLSAASEAQTTTPSPTPSGNAP